MTIWSGERHLRFPYIDRSGNATERDLLLRSVYKDNGSIYLSGYSFLREEERTFRFDRLAGEVIDAETGEIGSLADVLGLSPNDLKSEDVPVPKTAKKRSIRSIHSPRKVNQRKRVRAASGFEFPLLNSSATALVAITDETDYRDEFLSWLDTEERRSYNENEFLESLEWSLLDLYIQPFEEIIDSEHLKKLNHNYAPEVILVVRSALLEDGDELIVVDSPIKEKMLEKGFLTPVEITDTVTLRSALSGLRKNELTPEAKKLGIRTSLKKANLVEELLLQVERISLRFARPSRRIDGFIQKLGEAYIEDIKKSLDGYLDDYHAAVWKQVEDDYSLPESLRNVAGELFVQYEKRSQRGNKNHRSDELLEINGKSSDSGVIEYVINLKTNEEDKGAQKKTNYLKQALFIGIFLLVIYLLLTR